MINSQQKQALLWRLRLIFLYYSSYADRNNYKSLKLQNYRRFLIDSQAVTENSSFPPFDIAFRKIHTSAITLQQFQDLLPVISQLLYSKKSRKQAFKLFMGLHMERLYSQILNRSEFGSDITALQQLKIENESLELLDSIPIHRAYQLYIQSTSMHQKQPDHTFQQVHIFLSDFQVSPKLVYKAMVYLAFFHLLKSKQSHTWGLVDFQKLLIALAELYWRRSDQGNASQKQKVIKLLQRMQTSEGFKIMVDKTLKENAVLISFFKRQSRLMVGEIKRDLNGSVQKYEPKSTRNIENSRYFSAKRSRYNDNAPVKGLLFEQGDVAIKMREIFQRLCSHGDVGNTHTLKSIKIKRFFNTLNIMAPLQQTWVDITISELCRTSPSGKIQFSHFLQLLQLAAAKLKIANQALFHYLIEQCSAESQISKGYFSAQKINTEPAKQQISHQILFQVERPLQRIYNCYRKGKKGLSFDQICHLLFDFQIFPTFVSKSRLYGFFQQRSKATTALKKLVGEVLLDLRGCIQLLGDISNEISDNLTEQQRTLFLLQRMQDSQGHKTILGTQGTNLIGDLRAKYATIYRDSILKQGEKKVQGFKELLDGYDVS